MSKKQTANPLSEPVKTEIKWHNLPVTDVLANTGAKITGLTPAEAKERLAKYGPNELTVEKKSSPWLLFFNQFKSALIIILLVAVVLSVVVGILKMAGVLEGEVGTGLAEEITDAIVIFVIVIACVLLGFIEEFRSEKAMDALKRMSAPTATVIRDDEEEEIPASDLVPGDIVVLTTGDKVPADLRLTEVANLNTQEAPLTGESTPI
jgi:Ca2+-transporting ATPase